MGKGLKDDSGSSNDSYMPLKNSEDKDHRSDNNDNSNISIMLSPKFNYTDLNSYNLEDSNKNKNSSKITFGYNNIKSSEIKNSQYGLVSKKEESKNNVTKKNETYTRKNKGASRAQKGEIIFNNPYSKSEINVNTKYSLPSNNSYQPTDSPVIKAVHRKSYSKSPFDTYNNYEDINLYSDYNSSETAASYIRSKTPIHPLIPGYNPISYNLRDAGLEYNQRIMRSISPFSISINPHSGNIPPFQNKGYQNDIFIKNRAYKIPIDETIQMPGIFKQKSNAEVSNKEIDNKEFFNKYSSQSSLRLETSKLKIKIKKIADDFKKIEKKRRGLIDKEDILRAKKAKLIQKIKNKNLPSHLFKEIMNQIELSVGEIKSIPNRNGIITNDNSNLSNYDGNMDICTNNIDNNKELSDRDIDFSVGDLSSMQEQEAVEKLVAILNNFKTKKF